MSTQKDTVKAFTNMEAELYRLREVNADLLAALKEGRTLLEQDYSDADLLALHDDFDAVIAKAEEGS